MKLFIQRKTLAFGCSILLGMLNYQLQAQVLLQSNFQSGTQGWTTGQASTTCAASSTISSTWAIATSSGGSPIALGSSCYGTPNDGGLGPENSWILSPAFFPTSGYLTVNFDSWTSNEPGFPCNYDVELVEISQNGGAWTLIHGEVSTLHGIENDQTWRNFTFSASVTPSVSTRIRFRYDTGDDYNGSSSTGWYVDNVLIESSINFSFSTNNVNCSNSSNGSIQFTNPLGSAPFQYSIDNGTTFQNSANFNGLTAGSYTLVIKDVLNNVSAPKTAVINANNRVFAQLNANSPTIRCQGENVNLAALDSSGYQFRWKRNNAFMSSGNGPSTLTASLSGNYSVEVSKNGCSVNSNSINVQINLNPDLSIADVSNACSTGGAISFNAPNIGQAPFSYSIDGGNTFDTNSLYTGLSQGSYVAVVKDYNGCSSSQTALSVPSLVDTIKPTVVVKNATLYLDNLGLATLSNDQINNGSTDNCSNIAISLVPNSFNSSNLGANSVTFTATDLNQNSQSAVATVTVLDTIAPQMSAQNIFAYLDATGNAVITPSEINNNSTDNSGNLSLSLNKTNFTCADLGLNSVRLTGVDASGNTSICNARVTVLDIIKPQLSFLSNITITTNSVGASTLNLSQVNLGTTDNCGIQTIGLSQTAFSFAGQYTVVLTAIDFSGNTASGNITVWVRDVTPPTVITKNITRNISDNGTLVVSPTEFDSASFDAGSIFGYSVNKTNFDCSNIGPNPITLTVLDNSGNSSSAPATLTIIDNKAPVAIAKNITVTLGSSGSVTITANDINNGSTDNCGIQSINVSPSSFSVGQIGTNSVTLTVTDRSGNVSTAIATATVNGLTPPPPPPPTSTTASISITDLNIISWNNVPQLSNGQSGVITTSSSFNTTVAELESNGGNLRPNGSAGLGVSGGSLNSGCTGNSTFIDNTINKNQSVSFTLKNKNLGITTMAFESGITAKVTVIGKRDGRKVVSFSRLMTANVRDSFDFTESCALRGICSVDEVEFKLSNKSTNCKRGKDESLEISDEDYDDGMNLPTNCAFTVKNARFFVQTKDVCKIGDLSYDRKDDIFASDVVGISTSLQVGPSTTHSLGSNSDGLFNTGSPSINNPARRLIVGYNWLKFPSAWEISNNCDVRTIRQGMFSNNEALPVGSFLNLLFFDYTVTSVDANGQFIYGKRRSKSNNSSVDIRWKVNEFNQRVWIANPTLVSFNKTGTDEELIDVVDLAQESRSFGDLDLVVYPNPSNTEFTFKINSSESTPFSITLSDMAGRVVFESHNYSPTDEIRIGQELLAGVYLAQVKQGNSLKLVKITKTN